MATVVAFIDARIGEPAAIVDRLPPDTDWYVLAADDDGIGQMRRILAGYSDLAAIHVASHGGDGILYLGSTTLDSGSLTAHAAALADVGVALSEDGDLLLYGCDVGRGAAGAAFIDALAGLTGADVTASSDATGSAALGGNWTLEVATGPIEAASLSGGDFGALLAASVSISPQQAIRPEGSTGPTLFTFLLIRAGDVGAQQTVDWSVGGAGVHPADAADYGGILPSGTTTFAFGEVNKIVAVSVSGDTAVEFDEGFTVSLSNASGGLVILNGSANGAIQNDDSSVVSVAPLSAVKAEGNGATTTFTFTVSLDQPGVVDQTVSWSVAGDGTHPADAGDFGGSLPSGTASFAAGETSRTVTVLVSGDTAVEFDEGFAVKLSTPSAGLTLGPASAVGTVQNDDKSVVSIAPLSAAKPEGNSGTTAYTFAVVLVDDQDILQTVSWSVAGAGVHAADAADFGGSLPFGTATLQAGETSQVVTVLVSGDTAVEFDEEFTVTLSDPSVGLTIGKSAVGGIIDNDDVSTISIASLSADKAEGDVGTTSFTFTVSLDRPSVADQTVDWSVAGSGMHAADGVDFGGALPAGTVTFAAGETSKPLTVLALRDMSTEFDEKFLVTLSNGSAGLALGAASATGTIQNDDFPTVSIAALSAEKAEGDVGTTPFTFTVSLDRPGVTDQTVDWLVAGSGLHPADGMDFGGALSAGTVTFAAGETVMQVTVPVSGDMWNERDEQFLVTLSNASAGLVLGTVVFSTVVFGTIWNDDIPIISIVALSADEVEGDVGTTPFYFTVSLDQPGVTDQTVDWSVAGSGLHPADGMDFGGALPAGTVTFAAGETVMQVTVPVSGDMWNERDEQFSVTLSNASAGLVLGVKSATGTIQDDDPVPRLSIAALSAVQAEGDVGTTSFTFTVSLDRPDTVDRTVDWSVTGSGARPADGLDFGGALPAGTVTFAAGETDKLVTVPVSGDRSTEYDEQFLVTLSNASAGLALDKASASGAILNDDTSISVAALDVSKAEGNSGTTSFAFVITRSGDMSQSFDVPWTVSGSGANSATASDFAGGVLPSGIATILALEADKHIMVLVSGDTTVEPDEAYTLQVEPDPDEANPRYTVAGSGSASATILNDDMSVVSIGPVAVVTIRATSQADNTKFGQATVVLNQAPVEEQSVQWTMAGSGASPASGDDFTGGQFPAGSVTFAPGETSKTISFQISDDSTVEPDEMFTVQLSNPSSGLTIGVATAEGTIVNDDAVVSVAPLTAVRHEGLDGETVYLYGVTLSPLSVFVDDRGNAGIPPTFTVTWSVEGKGTDPAAASDFAGGVLPSGIVTLTAMETSATIAVPVSGDAAVEADEGFTVTLSNPSSGLTIGTATAAGTILNDDATVSIAAIDATRAEGTGGTTFFTFTATVTTDLGDTSTHEVGYWLAGTGASPATASDFVGGVLPSGTLTFAAGETSKSITVEVAGDAAIEPDQGFTLTLSSPSPGLMLGTANANGTIRNDDWSVTSSAAEDVGDAVILARAVDPDNVAGEWSTIGQFTITAGNEDGLFEIDTAGAISLAAGKALDYEASRRHVLTVTLIDHDGDSVFGPVGITIDVIDVDATVSIAATDATKAEGNGEATPFIFTVTVTTDLGDTSTHEVGFWMAGVGPTPADASDFIGGVLPTGTLTFAPGETSQTITVEVAGDTLVEADEDFALVAAINHDYSGDLQIGGYAEAKATILNDDATVSIAAVDATNAEGSGGTSTFTFAVTVTTDLGDTSTHEVGYWMAGVGPHPADASDFAGDVLPSGTLTFAAGETSKTITVEVAGDGLVEADEGFVVTLSNPSPGLVIGMASAAGTIVNDDTSISISAVDAVRPEGDSGTTTLTFAVARAGNVSGSQKYEYGHDSLYSLADAPGGDVIAAHNSDPADYFGSVLPSGAVTFAPGETSKTVTVNVAGDGIVEFDESFSIIVFDPSVGPSIDSPSAIGTILNDDRSKVSITAVGPGTCIDGDGDGFIDTCYMTVALDQPPVSAQTVHWSTAGSGPTPASASDFVSGVLPSGTLTFAPGETIKTIALIVTADTLVEPDEGFTVSLSDLSSGLVLGTASAVGTILNDDVRAYDDAYVVHQGQPLTVPQSAGVLANDLGASEAALYASPAHGTMQLAADGSFTYLPTAGFFGIDSFDYRALADEDHNDVVVRYNSIHVVPVLAGETTTLNLLALSAEEQITSTYAAFFSRAADAEGFEFWVDQFNTGLPVQGPATLFANIASSFGISDEAKALYPFLADPFGASDSQVSAFLESVYDNLFDRPSDASGLAYWTGQIRQTLAAGQFVGSVLVNIMSGAQDTAAGNDITTLMGKVAVSLAYVHQQQDHHTVWAGASDIAAATTLLEDVTDDPQTVLIGVRNAETLIAGHG